MPNPLPNPRLTSDQLINMANPLLASVRESLLTLSNNDPALLFALRRKIAKELQYDERGKPMMRRKLKAQKRMEQGGLCLLCTRKLPKRGAVLDRFTAIDGYTMANTRLLCPKCDSAVQTGRDFR
jgi:hypothetical protein